MHFDGKKVIVVGGSAGMGRQVAIDIVGHGGSAVIVGRSKARVDDTVSELTSDGEASGIVVDLTDRAAVADAQRALSEAVLTVGHARCRRAANMSGDSHPGGLRRADGGGSVAGLD
ncbi:hypothetical protein DQP58_15345 [Mycobacterium colombiense]|uniref:SDR family NAD(P)-dependent oxidoreductase n=1 Tax=Mycobacterium colombiense TaxID=339268 RepID=A0A329KF40_9MYCO|nr:SDR family NAD(P)-dependent oxidoreductase [Mycobacterium colombiense]RAU93983.1 hypothetical protein DQP58_15345 [Mycobacterium colombiense]